MTAPDPDRRNVFRTLWWLPAAEVMLILLVMFIHGGWPVPGSNEPHYLSKAKHYWDPAWCSKDFFCATADAHQVFYWVAGWPSLWLTLPQLAWVGRVAVWLLLACGWRRLSAALVPGPLYSVLGAALLVTLNDRCQLAGEWLVGGVEAKGFAYALLFFALSMLVRGRWLGTFALLGVATSLHVLVGGWSIVAACVAWMCARGERPRLGSLLGMLLLAAVFALPGLVPALMLNAGASPQTAAEATRIYVYERLQHHLLIDTFPWWHIARHALLVVLWAAMAWWDRRDSSVRRLHGFVLGAVCIALVGGAITVATLEHPELAARLLRYYWYRLSDIAVPIGVAILAARLIARVLPERRALGAALLTAAMLLVAAHLGELVVRRGRHPPAPGDGAVTSPADWRAACAWAGEHTPADAVFIVPRLVHSFRWHSGRAEVVNRKDVPQDARGIVAWYARMRDIFAGTDGAWIDSPAEVGTAQLKRVARKYDAQYVITASSPMLDFELVSPPGLAYSIYKVPSDPSNPSRLRPSRIKVDRK